MRQYYLSFAEVTVLLSRKRQKEKNPCTKKHQVSKSTIRNQTIVWGWVVFGRKVVLRYCVVRKTIVGVKWSFIFE